MLYANLVLYLSQRILINEEVLIRLSGIGRMSVWLG